MANTRQKTPQIDQADLQFMLDNMHDLVSHTDAYGAIKFINSSCKTLLGYEPTELVGRQVFDFVHPDDVDSTRSVFQRGISDIGFQACECRLRHSEGHYLLLETTWKVLVDNAASQVTGAVFSSREIGDRKVIEDERNAIFHLSPDILGSASFRGDLIDISPACERILGWKPHELLSMKLLDLVHSDDLQETEFLMKKMENGELINLFRNRLRCKDGSYRWLSWDYNPSTEKGFIYFVARDITEKVNAETQCTEQRNSLEQEVAMRIDNLLDLGTKLEEEIERRVQAEKRLLNKERHLRESQAAAGIGSYVVDLAGDSCYSSRVLSDILGIEKEENPLEIWPALIHPAHRDQVMAQHKRILDGEKSFNQEYIIVRPDDGEERWVHDVGAVEYDENGNRSLLIGTIMDITERKRSTQQLQERESRLRLLTDNMMDMVAQADEDGVFRYVSPSYKDVLGYEPHELLGIEIFALVHPDDLDGVMKNAAEIEAAKVSGRAEFRFRHANGNYVWIEAIGNYITDENGELSGYVITSRDISERRKADEEKQRLLHLYHQAIEGAIRAMGRVVDKRDPYTAGHQQRVARLAVAIANELTLEPKRVDGLRLAAQIHDIGKVSVPSEILSKPGRISELEFGIIKTHARVGSEILRGIDFPWPLAQIIAQHHEKMDGSGYDGLLGEEILLEARILCVADVVEAMASHRPYRPALGIEIALNEIRRKKGTLFDEDVVNACVELFGKGDYQKQLFSLG